MDKPLDTREDKNRFNCPIDGCVYGINGNKHFKRKLLLTQHIANKHSEKRFTCDKCHKKYAIEWQLKYHYKWCGFQWRCGSCDKSYSERLSLVMHCKRRSHLLPQNGSTKKTKSAITSSPISVQLIVMPLILNSSSSSYQSLCPPNAGQNQKLLNILPKSNANNNDLNQSTDCWTQTLRQECNECKTKNSFKSIETKAKNCLSISTQTERMAEKCLKSRESRSTECQTIRKRNRRPQMNNNYESIETQTLESTLHSNGSSDRIQICASTSTTPPKKTRRKPLVTGSDVTDVNKVIKSSAFTQTVRQSCASAATATEDLEVLVNDLNPLLSQTNSSAILEQSVQTEAIDISFDNLFNNIETQTVNLEINSNNLLDFSADEEFLFSDLEFTDIETQTIWNNDRTTQTDEYLDQINDVILRYLDNNDNNVCNVSDKTLFADTETQTQTDFPLICSAVQTSQPFS